MKSKTNNSKAGLVLGLVLALPLLAAAQAPDPAIYVCGTGEATLTYNGGTEHTLAVGDTVHWQEFDAGNNPVSGGIDLDIVVGPANTDGHLTLTGGGNLTVAGAHYFKVYAISSDPTICTGDVSDPYNIYMLPSSSVALTTNSGSLTGAYCADGSSNTTKSVITATSTPAGTLPADIIYNYTWSANKGADAVADISTVGTDDDATGTVNKFTMSATDEGVYTILAKINYVSSSSTIIKSGTDDGAGCEETAPTAATITVTKAPGKPTISVN